MSGLIYRTSTATIEADITTLQADVSALQTAVGSWSLLTGEADPSAASGVVATQPALYARITAGVMTCYAKTGAADTAWTLAVLANHTGNVVLTGNLSAERVLLTTAGALGAPALALPDGQGIYAEGANFLSFAASAVRLLRLSSAAGSQFFNSVVAVAQYLAITGVQDTTLSATTHNLSLSAVGTLRLATSGGAQTLTSITGGSAGRFLWIENDGPAAVTLQHDNTVDGTAANRLLLPNSADLVIRANGGVMAKYLASSTNRWEVAQP